MSTTAVQIEARYLSYSGAAKYLNISIGTLRRIVESGSVRAYRIGAKLCRFDREELDQLVRSQVTATIAAKD